MMILRSFPPGFGCPSLSPFCVKAMYLLETAGVKWQPDFQADPRRAPKGKFPVLVDGDEIVADTWAIRAYLERTYHVDFDDGLDATKRAKGHALARMVEDHLYFALVHDRWINDAHWPTVRETYFAEIPRPLRGFVTRKLRKDVARDLDGHGIARHSADDIVAAAKRDLSAIRQSMQGAYLMGDRLSSADYSVAPILQAIAASPGDSALKAAVRSDADLMAYLLRVETHLSGDVVWQSAA